MLSEVVVVIVIRLHVVVLTLKTRRLPCHVIVLGPIVLCVAGLGGMGLVATASLS